MLSEDHLLARKKGIGGSEVAALLGLCPYKNIWDLYMDKVSEQDYIPPFNKYMKWGQLLESGIAQGYAETTKAELESPNVLRVHPDHPFLLGTPDYLIAGKKKGLEIKNVGSKAAKQWGPNGSNTVPINYYLQISHYMLVLDYDEWDLAALIGGNDLRIYTFQRNKIVEKAILSESMRFWHDNVEKKVAPPRDKLHSSNLAKIRQTYREVSGEVILEAEFTTWKKDWLEAKREVAKNEQRRQQAEAQLLVAMGDHKTATFSDGSQLTRKMISKGAYLVNPTSYIQLNYKEK